MKKMLLLFLLLAGCAAQSAEHAGMNHAMPEGIMKVHANNDTMNLHDYTITFVRPEITAEKETILSIKLMKGDKPLTLQTLHGMPMHMIIVSKDLNTFYHLHPEETAPGTLTAKNIFEESGDYRIWVEYMSEDLEHTVDYDITVQKP